MVASGWPGPLDMPEPDPLSPEGLSAAISVATRALGDILDQLAQKAANGTATVNDRALADQCDKNIRALANLQVAAVANALQNIFATAQQDADNLRALIKEMKNKASEINNSEQALSNFVGIVADMIDIITLAVTPGVGVPAVMAKVGAAAGKWLGP